MQEAILSKRIRLHVIDANGVAASTGMGRRINTIMQTCFFALSGVLPRDEAIDAIKQAIEKTYRKRGEDVVHQNFDAVDQTLTHFFACTTADRVARTDTAPPLVPAVAPDFVQRVTARIMAGEGDRLPVSAFPVDGTFPPGTSQWEKRNLATDIVRAGIISVRCRKSMSRRCQAGSSSVCSSCSRTSSSRARAPDAAKRRTSAC